MYRRTALVRESLEEEYSALVKGSGLQQFPGARTARMKSLAGGMTASWRNRKKSDVATAGSVAGNEHRDISNGRTTWDLAGKGPSHLLSRPKHL